MNFDAKVDLWFTGVMLVSALVNFAPAILMKKRHILMRALLVVCGLGFLVGLALVHLETWHVDQRHISSTMPVFGGPVVVVKDIIAVKPSRDGRSSRGASFDRLRISARNSDPVFLSVHDKAGFLRAVADSAPHLILDGEMLRMR